ncbi:MAG: hypothetical protein HKN81_05515 [Gammaproteobacteria bacterium]|nr:hypothetical protein [Gammaproteobacteria bacterium]NND36578.1 hypothetical protein [Gammaproteobacteria bacterium]
MTSTILRRLAVLCVGICLATAAGAAPKVKRTQKLEKDAGAPFGHVLVVALFSEYGARRTLEKRIVSLLEERGTKAVASTSMMDTKTPMTPTIYIDMVDRTGVDALLVTEFIGGDSDVKAVDANPETTVNVRPTYYFNVWNVEVTEYVEPQFVTAQVEVHLATQMLSVAKEGPVWAIESKLKFKQDISQPRPYAAYDQESESIVKYLVRDRVIAKK